MKKFVIVCAAFCAITNVSMLSARTRNVLKKHDENRIAEINNGRVTTLSYIETSIANTGKNFGDVTGAQKAGTFWPRGSGNSYIYGGGLWFVALKDVNGKRIKLAEVGYNPNDGSGAFAPGEWADGKNDPGDPARNEKYKLYFSTDYDKTSGNRLDGTGNPWPIWVRKGNTLLENRYLGEYVSDVASRASGSDVTAPAFISQEDIFAIYKDSETELLSGYAPGNGYPLGMEIEQTVYTWGFGKYKDFIFLRYKIHNRSKDTLYDCYVAPAFDPDIGDESANANDHNGFYDVDPSLNLAYQFGGPDDFKNPNGVGTTYGGYLGFDFLESPAVENGFVRQADSLHPGLGLTTFRQWIIQNDPSTAELRYNFCAAGQKDIDQGDAGDKRLLMATGPFNMRPGDSAITTIAILLSRAGSNAPQAQLTSLVALDKFAQSVYDNSFAAPRPPDAPKMTYKPLDKGINLSWDNTADNSIDNYSCGLPFYGYTLERSSRPDFDTTFTKEGYAFLGRWHRILKSDGMTDSIPMSTTIPHSYIDFGDNNNDGIVEPVNGEGLLNNITYYYRLRAYDQGCKQDNVDSLYSSDIFGRSKIATVPLGRGAGNFGEVASQETVGYLGGISNLRLNIENEQLFGQLFNDDDIILTFNPAALDGTNPYSDIMMRVTNVKNNLDTFVVQKSSGVTVRLGNSDSKPLGFGKTDSSFAGTVNTGVGTTFAPNQKILQAFSVSFDYRGIQYKTKYGLDTATFSRTGGADVAMKNLAVIDHGIIRKGDIPDNIGPAMYEVTFSAGGTEQLTVTGFQGKQKKSVPYLNVSVKNVTTGKVYQPVQVALNATPGYGEFTMNYRSQSNPDGGTIAAVATQGNRYYLTTKNAAGDTTFRFANTLFISGGKLMFDSAATPGGAKEFTAGNTARFGFSNGAWGQPEPGTQVVFHTTKTDVDSKDITTSELDQVRIVPNPYIIGHIAQKTTDDAKLFFNHLPNRCTIRIYTIDGDLVKTLKHNVDLTPNSASSETWDLLTDARRRVASQVLLAQIEAESGAKKTLKFAIITGGFRIVTGN